MLHLSFRIMSAVWFPMRNLCGGWSRDKKQMRAITGIQKHDALAIKSTRRIIAKMFCLKTLRDCCDIYESLFTNYQITPVSIWQRTFLRAEMEGDVRRKPSGPEKVPDSHIRQRKTKPDFLFRCQEMKIEAWGDSPRVYPFGYQMETPLVSTYRWFCAVIVPLTDFPDVFSESSMNFSMCRVKSMHFCGSSQAHGSRFQRYFLSARTHWANFDINDLQKNIHG